MNGTQLSPEKITSPFQLMAAWFAMLVLIVSVLLTAAANISKPDWAAGYLVIFASVVVLIVIGCVILMLTKFRPNLQEGKEYAEWLKDQNTYSTGYLVKKSSSPLKSRSLATGGKSLLRKEQTKGFQINVINAPGGVELVEKLKHAGFAAEIYKAPRISEENIPNSTEQNEGIWVGSRLSPREAIEAIKLAVNHWPNLKYVNLSGNGSDPPDYVHDQLFIGGASAAAERYGLKPWTPGELLSLDEEMSINDFHALVRTKYP